MTNYDRGAYLERKAIVELARAGRYCLRSAGSRGVVDLAAFHPDGDHWLVQCKVKRDGLDHDGWNRLLELARTFGVRPVLASWERRGRIQYEELLDRHEARSHEWPARELPVEPIATEPAIVVESLYRPELVDEDW